MSKIDKSFKGTVSVVGLGVGPQDLTEAHREAIEAAEVLVCGKRQLAVFAGQRERTWVLGANPATTLEAEIGRASCRERV